MASPVREARGIRELLMGNVAIARGALEAGVQFVTGYPGTPSSEIVGTLAEVAKETGIYVEWSINEKVATEAAAAASLAGLRALSAMKTAGLNVALDFLAHLSYSGLGRNNGGLVIVVCDDPEGHSSGDEADSRWVAKSEGIPLLEPESSQEAVDMTKWAFELSEEFHGFCLIRSYTRLSLSSGPVTLGKIPPAKKQAHFDTTQPTISPYLAKLHHASALEKLAKIREVLERSTFNWYEGPENPELLIVGSGVGHRYAREAIEALGLEKSVGVLKLGTLWPFPKGLVARYLTRTKQVLTLEEVDPFLEIHVKETAFESPAVPKSLKVYGKDSGHIPKVGELTPDLVLKALGTLFELNYPGRETNYEQKVREAAKILIDRGVTWCAGCAHRASFWAMKKATQKDGRDGFLTGDIGCYTLDVYPTGDKLTKVLHAMGSGVGLATGFGKLHQFGSEQPVIAVCGDSTFYHAAIPALISARHHRANLVVVILDNGATAMTGFQPHPGTAFDAMGNPAPVIDAEKLCQSLGCRVVVTDPFDLKGTTDKLLQLMKEDGVGVLIMRRKCELVRMREERKYPYQVWVEVEKCRGEKCGYCTKSFKCPALPWDMTIGKAMIDEAVCCGCGVCVDLCPYEAIVREERQ